LVDSVSGTGAGEGEGVGMLDEAEAETTGTAEVEDAGRTGAVLGAAGVAALLRMAARSSFVCFFRASIILDNHIRHN